jgi:hypothetical protein
MKCLTQMLTVTFAIALVARGFLLTSSSKAEAAASGLTLAEACQPDGTASLLFAWTGIDPAARELWLDVTVSNNWQPDSFTMRGL